MSEADAFVVELILFLAVVGAALIGWAGLSSDKYHDLKRW